MTIFGILAVFSTVLGMAGCRDTDWGLRFSYERCFTLQTLGHMSQYEKIFAVLVAGKFLLVSNSSLG